MEPAGKLLALDLGHSIVLPALVQAQYRAYGNVLKGSLLVR